jgi:hypothetical protein
MSQRLRGKQCSSSTRSRACLSAAMITRRGRTHAKRLIAVRRSLAGHRRLRLHPHRPPASSCLCRRQQRQLAASSHRLAQRANPTRTRWRGIMLSLTVSRKNPTAMTSALVAVVVMAVVMVLAVVLAVVLVLVLAVVVVAAWQPTATEPTARAVSPAALDSSEKGLVTQPRPLRQPHPGRRRRLTQPRLLVSDETQHQSHRPCHREQSRLHPRCHRCLNLQTACRSTLSWCQRPQARAQNPTRPPRRFCCNPPLRLLS